MLRRGWAGPHPLLLAATVLLYAVATLVSNDSGATPTSDGAVELAAGVPQGPGLSADTPVLTTVRAEPETRVREVVGVATFNAYKQLSRTRTVADARTLARDDAVDVIGWQEAYRMAAVRPELKKLGWRTEWARGESEELAISWRTKRFAFVRADRRRVAPGIDSSANHPVSARYVLRVVLRERSTGLRTSIVTTHLPQAIESEEQPGTWRATYNAARAQRQLAALGRIIDGSPGRWVITTGDFNLDARAEQEQRPRRGPSRVLRGRAVSSYERLGIGDLSPTHPVSGRHIDYVYAGADDLRQDRLSFLRQRTIGGLSSDHRPLLVRLALT